MVRQLLPRLHNLCHVDSRVTMLSYSLNMFSFGSNVINLPCNVCLTACVPSPYSSIPREKSQSYVVLIEFEWNGLKVSEVNNLNNRKFLEQGLTQTFMSSGPQDPQLRGYGGPKFFLLVPTTTNVTTLLKIFTLAMCLHIDNFVKPQKA